jgi:threonine aldolase
VPLAASSGSVRLRFELHDTNQRLLAEIGRHRATEAALLQAQKLEAIGLNPVWPVEANLVFVALPRALDLKLKAAGASYYVRASETVELGDERVLARLVTSFATQDEEIERFVRLCESNSG